MPAPETSPQVLALADDLTGALEVGALLAASGLRALAGIERMPAAEAVVVDIESRHLDPDAAASRVIQFASPARDSGVPLIFLKIDSTMRGPIAAELQALSRLWPGKPIHFTPAYPALGRTVVNGKLLVDGIPLHETAFGRDPTHPASTSGIREMIEIDAATIRLLDAGSDGDLARIADCLLKSARPLIVAGSGGLARHLFRPKPPHLKICARRPLVISGSMHAIAIEQLRRAGSWPVLECSAFSNGHDGLKHIATAAREHIRRGDADAVVVFGGDTAKALMQALDITAIEPLGEALAGVPVSRITYEARQLTLITKAGGFGPADLLPQLASALHTEI